MRPSKGARMVFFAMVAFSVATLAAACSRARAAASSSAGEFDFACRRLRARQVGPRQVGVGLGGGELGLFGGDVELHQHRALAHEGAGVEADLADRARQLRASVTPRTATSVPTAGREACHSTGSTLAEVTDSGGMAEGLPGLDHRADLHGLDAASTTTTTHQGGDGDHPDAAAVDGHGALFGACCDVHESPGRMRPLDIA